MNEHVSFKPSLRDIYWKKFKSLVRPRRYHEVYKEADERYHLPIKENYRDGELISGILLAWPLLPKEYLEDRYVPSFAQGKCQIIGEGDYKIVVVDKDGKNDTVIKFYTWHSYEGQDAREKAQAAVGKIKIIHEIAGIIAPGFVLPSEMVIDERGGEFTVCEIQQRAEVIPVAFFDSKTAERLDKEAMNVAINGTRLVERELIRRGLSRVNPLTGMISDDFSLTEIHWDARTNHLVSLDIVDQVDITLLLPPNFTR